MTPTIFHSNRMQISYNSLKRKASAHAPGAKLVSRLAIAASGALLASVSQMYCCSVHSEPEALP